MLLPKWLANRAALIFHSPPLTPRAGASGREAPLMSLSDCFFFIAAWRLESSGRAETVAVVVPVRREVPAAEGHAAVEGIVDQRPAAKEPKRARY